MKTFIRRLNNLNSRKHSSSLISEEVEPFFDILIQLPNGREMVIQGDDKNRLSIRTKTGQTILISHQTSQNSIEIVPVDYIEEYLKITKGNGNE